MRSMGLAVIFLSVIGSDVFAQESQFEHCNALIRYGMQDINTKFSADTATGYNYHKYCRTQSEKMTDSTLSEAEASIFGFGDGSGSFDRRRAKERLDSFCKENENISSRSSTLYSKAMKYSGPALEAWNQCQQAAKKLVQISLTHSSDNASRLTFSIDSTQDGTLYLTGIEQKGYACSVFNATESGNTSLTPASKDNSGLTFSKTAINNQNIHIGCDRVKASIDSGDEVKTLKYEEGHVSIFTTGPSFSITVPELVEEYHHTPKNSVLAFFSDSCPAGWDFYEPAFGRFVRGIDRTDSKVDPEGKREPGSIQDESFKNHSHGYSDIYWSEAWGSVSSGLYGNKGDQDKDNKGYAMDRTTSGSGGDETRPDNVALLYCIKK